MSRRCIVRSRSTARTKKTTEVDEPEVDEACKIEMAHLGLDNPRTSSPPRLQAWIETLQASDALRNRSHSQDHLAAKLKRAGKSQRWQDQVVNLILASVDRVLDEDEPRRTPLVLFGSGGGRTNSGWIGVSPKPCAQIFHCDHCGRIPHLPGVPTLPWTE